MDLKKSFSSKSNKGDKARTNKKETSKTFSSSSTGKSLASPVGSINSTSWKSLNREKCSKPNRNSWLNTWCFVDRKSSQEQRPRGKNEHEHHMRKFRALTQRSTSSSRTTLDTPSVCQLKRPHLRDEHCERTPLHKTAKFLISAFILLPVTGFVYFLFYQTQKHNAVTCRDFFHISCGGSTENIRNSLARAREVADSVVIEAASIGQSQEAKLVHQMIEKCVEQREGTNSFRANVNQLYSNIFGKAKNWPTAYSNLVSMGGLYRMPFFSIEDHHELANTVVIKPSPLTFGIGITSHILFSRSTHKQFSDLVHYLLLEFCETDKECLHNLNENVADILHFELKFFSVMVVERQMIPAKIGVAEMLDREKFRRKFEKKKLNQSGTGGFNFGSLFGGNKIQTEWDAMQMILKNYRPEATHFVVYDAKYIKRIVNIALFADYSLIVNYMTWYFILNHLHISTKMSKRWQLFLNILDGSSLSEDPAQHCLDYVRNVSPQLVSSLYVPAGHVSKTLSVVDTAVNSMANMSKVSVRNAEEVEATSLSGAKQPLLNLLPSVRPRLPPDATHSLCAHVTPFSTCIQYDTATHTLKVPHALMAEHTLLEHGRLLILATYTRAYHYYMDQLTENRSLLNWRPGADYIVYDDSSTIKAKALAAVFDSIFQGKINKNEFLQQVLQLCGLSSLFYPGPSVMNIVLRKSRLHHKLYGCKPNTDHS